MDRRHFFKLSTIAALATALPAVARADAKRVGGKDSRYRVTVVRRECFRDLQSGFLDEPESGPCPLFKTGEVWSMTPAEAEKYVAEGRFCRKAWESIKSHVDAIIEGNTRCDVKPAVDDVNVAMACCNDGTRPVIFKVEWT
ncbi:MAG: TIGR04076 family protein [Muribaculaceae bacterium]|nr:TIGR04076 family protein [Muribaculaceae bacterium]